MAFIEHIQGVAKSAQKHRGISAVLKGDEAGSLIHLCTSQPVCSLTGQGRFSDTTKAMKHHHFSLQEIPLDLKQLVCSSTKAITGLRRHPFAESLQRRGHRYFFTLSCGL